MFGQNKYRPPETDRLDLFLGKCIDEMTENNNEYFYQKQMLCRIKLVESFKEKMSPFLQDKLLIAEQYWNAFIPNENYPTSEIDFEFINLSKRRDFEKNDNAQLHLRIIRLLFKKYDSESTDENIDCFMLFFEYLIKLGFYKEDLADAVENLFE